MITINDTEDLLQLLIAALPYEYSEHLNKNTETIKITKENSDTVVYIEESASEPGILNATAYANETDDDPIYEGIQWDIELQSPAAIVNDIKQLF